MKEYTKIGFIYVGIALALVTGLIAAEGEDSLRMWNCIGLLDEQTRSDLVSQERFFAGLFQLPSGYEAASNQEKMQTVNQWIGDLQSRNNKKIADAAAYLGIVKANSAAKHLEKLLSSGKVRGRARWVCTRSLGQIGSKEAIPTLINLLDSANRDTRIYARVSLAEITGVYFADDKEKWKSRQKGEPVEVCTPVECKSPADNQSFFSSRSQSSANRLSFHLPDVFGRMVDSKDYAGFPVLIMSGSCWCGGCQQDAEPLRRIAAEYAPRGLRTIRTVAGDNELAALDFQRHYRLPFVHLLDTNRSFERRYNDDGWTFLMLADREGKILFKVNGPQEKTGARCKTP